MDIRSMRLYVSRAYIGEGWKAKVRKMSDEQIVAIYYRMVAEKEQHRARALNEARRRQTERSYADEEPLYPKVVAPPEPSTDVPQITFEEILNRRIEEMKGLGEN